MAVRVRFEQRDGSLLLGHVEVNDVDISNRVSALRFDRSMSGMSTLTLTVPLGKGGKDEVDLLLEDSEVTVVCAEPQDSPPVDMTRIGSAIREYLAGRD